jgi:hypothetical protein
MPAAATPRNFPVRVEFNRDKASGAPQFWSHTMNKLKIILTVAVCALACAAMAQDTNLITTHIGLFEARTGVVLIKGSGQLGSIPLGPAQLSVRSKETTDANTGEKIYGLAIEIEGSQLAREIVLVDDDEVDSLLNGVNYLAKINYDVTTLPGFEASYTTKAGLRVIADSMRKEGGVLAFVQFGDGPRISLSSVQLTQFYGLISQGRKSLDALKSGK